MAPISKQAQKAFRQWGQRGGKRRAKCLSAPQRQAIARQAAEKRWRRVPAPPMTSVRLDAPVWQDPVYLTEVLSRGTLQEWRELRRIVAEHPFGAVAIALECVLAATTLYGTTRLWQMLLRHWQGVYP